MSRAILSLGGNVGDRQRYLAQACAELGRQTGLRILRATTTLDNPALLVEDQAPFLNQLLEIETALSPEDLLDLLKSLEGRLGRIDRFRYGPREIDLDILWFEGELRDSNNLAIPHPALDSRAYVRQLLAQWELSPEELLRA
ncbi:MAG: 2-amino-4-hydroxy-6-hydroxymethyldihydropteridine diphosphokinase [Leptospirales bacterium]|nr:2-amino-4-hydroxy-6-hydroxymethyldihydropteridine diphosphokinase [Leptospirales bacterium]